MEMNWANCLKFTFIDFRSVIISTQKILDVSRYVSNEPFYF